MKKVYNSPAINLLSVTTDNMICTSLGFGGSAQGAGGTTPGGNGGNGLARANNAGISVTGVDAHWDGDL